MDRLRNPRQYPFHEPPQFSEDQAAHAPQIAASRSLSIPGACLPLHISNHQLPPPNAPRVYCHRPLDTTPIRLPASGFSNFRQFFLCLLHHGRAAALPRIPARKAAARLRTPVSRLRTHHSVVAGFSLSSDYCHSSVNKHPRPRTSSVIRLCSPVSGFPARYLLFLCLLHQCRAAALLRTSGLLGFAVPRQDKQPAALHRGPQVRSSRQADRPYKAQTPNSSIFLPCVPHPFPPTLELWNSRTVPGSMKRRLPPR